MDVLRLLTKIINYRYTTKNSNYNKTPSHLVRGFLFIRKGPSIGMGYYNGKNNFSKKWGVFVGLLFETTYSVIIALNSKNKFLEIFKEMSMV